MRTRRILALGLLLTMTAAGCGKARTGDGVASAGGAPTVSSSSAASATEKGQDAPLRFAQCMRGQGMTWFPDPNPDGRVQIKIPKGANKAKVDAAMEACKKWAPNISDKGRMDPEQLERARQMAQCMRDNGVKNFPDPDPNGNLRLDGGKVGMGPGDPTFDKADETCSKYRPSGPRVGNGDKAEVRTA